MKYVPVEKRKIGKRLKLSWRIRAAWFGLIRPVFVKDIDLNEEFHCCNCLKPLLGRYLTCSEACYRELWRDVVEQMIEEAGNKAEETA